MPAPSSRDADLHLAVRSSRGGDVDVRAVGRELRCIRQQIADHLREPDHVAVDLQRLRRRIDRHRLPPCGDHRPRGLERALDDILCDQALPLQLDLVAGDARDVQQVVDEAREMRGLPLQDAAHLPDGRRLVGARAKNRRDVEDRRERIAQLVRQHREELVLAPVRLQQQRLAVEELAMRDLQAVQDLDQRRADEHEERDVGQPAERIAPAEVRLELHRAQDRAGQRDQPGRTAAAQVASHEDRQHERQQRTVPADEGRELRRARRPCRRAGRLPGHSEARPARPAAVGRPTIPGRGRIALPCI